MDTLSYKTVSANKETVKKEWLLVDATGLSLGRLASQVAIVLRGKHKPSYTPHVDCGDYVVIINADKIELTGKKWQQKEYKRYTGFPGGQRIETAEEVFQKDPKRLIERAVLGMLPKNRLGRKLFNNMKVYVGTDHPHTAQNPQQLNINEIKK